MLNGGNLSVKRMSEWVACVYESTKKNNYLDSFSHKGHYIDFMAYEYFATTEAHNFTIWLVLYLNQDIRHAIFL